MSEQFVRDAQNDLERQKQDVAENFTEHLEDLSGLDITKMTFESMIERASALEDEVLQLEQRYETLNSTFEAEKDSLEKPEKKAREKEVKEVKERMLMQKENLKALESEILNTEAVLQNPERNKDKVESLIFEQGQRDKREISEAEQVLNLETNEEIANLASPERIREVFGEQNLDCLFSAVMQNYQEVTANKKEKGWKSRESYWKQWLQGAEGFENVGIAPTHILDIITTIEKQLDQEAVNTIEYFDEREKRNNQKKQQEKDYIKEEAGIKGSAKKYTKKSWQITKKTLGFSGKMGAKVGMYMGIGAAAAGATGLFAATAAFAPIAGVTAPLAIRALGTYRTFREKGKRLEKQKKQTAENYQEDGAMQKELKQKVLELIAEQKAKDLRQERLKQGQDIMDNKTAVNLVNAKASAEEYMRSEGHDESKIEGYLKNAEKGNIDQIEAELVSLDKRDAYDYAVSVMAEAEKFMVIEDDKDKKAEERNVIAQLESEGVDVNERVIEIIKQQGENIPAIMKELEKENIIPEKEELNGDATEEEKESQQAIEKQRIAIENLITQLQKLKFSARKAIFDSLDYFGDEAQKEVIIDMLSISGISAEQRLKNLRTEFIAQNPENEELLKAKDIIDLCKDIFEKKQRLNRESGGMNTETVEEEIQFYSAKRNYIDSIVSGSSNEKKVEKRVAAQDALRKIMRRVLSPKEAEEQLVSFMEKGAYNAAGIEFVIRGAASEHKQEISNMIDPENGEPDSEKIQKRLLELGADEKTVSELLQDEEVSVKGVLEFLDGFFQLDNAGAIAQEFINTNQVDGQEENAIQESFEEELDKRAQKMRPRMQLISAKLLLQKQIAKVQDIKPKNQKESATQRSRLKKLVEMIGEVDQKLNKNDFQKWDEIVEKIAEVSKEEEDVSVEIFEHMKIGIDSKVESMIRSSILLYKADQRNQAMNEALGLQLAQHGNEKKSHYDYQEIDELKQLHLSQNKGAGSTVGFLEKTLNFQKTQREKTAAALLATGATMRFGRVLEVPGLKEYGGKAMYWLGGGMLGIQVADAVVQSKMGGFGKIDQNRSFENSMKVLQVLEEEISLEKVQAESFANLDFDIARYTSRLAEVKKIQRLMDMDAQTQKTQELGMRVRVVEQRISMYSALLMQRRRVEEQYAKTAEATKTYAAEKDTRAKVEVIAKSIGFAAGATLVGWAAGEVPEILAGLSDRMNEGQENAQSAIGKNITPRIETHADQFEHVGEELEEQVAPDEKADAATDLAGDKATEIIPDKGDDVEATPSEAGSNPIITETVTVSNSTSETALEEGFIEPEELEIEEHAVEEPQVEVREMEEISKDSEQVAEPDAPEGGESSNEQQEEVPEPQEEQGPAEEVSTMEEKIAQNKAIKVSEIVRNPEKIHLSTEQAQTLRLYEQNHSTLGKPEAAYEALGGECAKVYNLEGTENGLKIIEISSSPDEEPYRKVFLYGDGKYALDTGASNDGFHYVERGEISGSRAEELTSFDKITKGEDVPEMPRLSDLDQMDMQETRNPKGEYSAEDIVKYFEVINQGNYDPEKVLMDPNGEKPIFLNIGSKEVVLGYDGEETKMLIFNDNGISSSENRAACAELIEKFKQGKIDYDEFSKGIDDNIRYSEATFKEGSSDQKMVLYGAGEKTEIESSGQNAHEVKYAEVGDSYKKAVETRWENKGTPEEIIIESQFNGDEELASRETKDVNGKQLLVEKYDEDGDLEKAFKTIYKSDAVLGEGKIQEIYTKGEGSGDLNSEDLKYPKKVYFYDKEGYRLKLIENEYMKGGIFSSQQGFLEKQEVHWGEGTGETVRTPLRTGRLGGIYGYKDIYTDTSTGESTIRETLLSSDNSGTQEEIYYKIEDGKEVKDHSVFHEEGANGRQFRDVEVKYGEIDGERVPVEKKIAYFDRAGEKVQGETRVEFKSDGKGSGEWIEKGRTTYTYDEAGNKIATAEYAINDREVITTIKETRAGGGEKQYKTVSEIRGFLDTQDVYKDGEMLIDREDGKHSIKYEYEDGHVEKLRVYSPDGKMIRETWEVNRDKQGVPKGFTQVTYADDMTRRIIVHYDHKGESELGFSEVRIRHAAIGDRYDGDGEKILKRAGWMTERQGGWEGPRYLIAKMMKFSKLDVLGPDS